MNPLIIVLSILYADKIRRFMVVKRLVLKRRMWTFIITEVYIQPHTFLKSSTE